MESCDHDDVLARLESTLEVLSDELSDCLEQVTAEDMAWFLEETEALWLEALHYQGELREGRNGVQEA